MKQFHIPDVLHLRSAVLGGADWAEDILAWATSDFSIKGQKSFMDVARQRLTVLSLVKVDLTEATQAF